MVTQTLIAVFWTGLAALGFANAFARIEAWGKRFASKHHHLNQFTQELPLVIFVCALMLEMRVMNRGVNLTDINQYWLLISTQMVFMTYTDLMVDSVWSFLIIKVFCALAFAETRAMTVVLWGLFVVSGLAIFLESHYSRHWSRDNPWLFALPPAVIAVAFWGLMSMLWHPAKEIVVANGIGFLAAIMVLFVSERSQTNNQQIISRLTHAVQFDALTGVRNWSMFQTDFNAAFANVKTDWPLAVLALDLDNFKMINDTYGHLSGNAVLGAAAGMIEETLQKRSPDYHVYRTGGEEFSVILPHTCAMTAKQVSLECQTAIRGLHVQVVASELHLTASFGLTQALDKDPNATATFKRADEALYRSKRAGRDRLTINEDTLSA